MKIPNPAELAQKRIENLSGVIEEVTRVIVTDLEARWEDQLTGGLNISMPPLVGKDGEPLLSGQVATVRQKIRETFLANGWEVEFRSEQREGPYVNVKPLNPKYE